MKKEYLGLGALLACLLLASNCGRNSTSQTPTPDTNEPPKLRFLNWEQNIDPDLIIAFEKETKIKVETEYLSSTEQLEARLLEDHSAYDLVVLDDTSLQNYKEMRTLQPLNRDWLSNLGNIRQGLTPVDPTYELAVPYFHGASILVYNKDKIDPPPSSWRDLWNPAYKGRVALMEDHWDYLGFGMVANGLAFQENNAEHHAKAVEGFEGFLEHCGAITDFSSVLDQVASGEMWIGTCYNGDAAQFARENKSLGYIMPKEGSMRWLDMLAVTRHAEHPHNAHRFINFLLEKKNAAQNANHLLYPTLVNSAKELLDPQIKDDPALNWPKETFAKCPSYPPMTDTMLRTHTKLRDLANHRKARLKTVGKSAKN